MRNGGIKMMLRAMAASQLFKRAGKFAAQRVGLVELPVVKAGTVAQAEARQEVILVKRYGSRKRLDTGSTNIARQVSVRAAFRQETAKIMHVYPNAGVEVETQYFSFNIEPLPPQRFVERGKGVSQ